MFWFKTYELFIFSVIFWFMLQSYDTNYDAAFCCLKVIWICKKMPDVILLLIYRIRIMTFPWLAWDIHCLIGRKFVMTTIFLHFAYEISKDEVLHEISVTAMKWMQWEAMGMFHLFSSCDIYWNNFEQSLFKDELWSKHFKIYSNHLKEMLPCRLRCHSDSLSRITKKFPKISVN